MDIHNILWALQLADTQQRMSNWPYSYLFKNIYYGYDAMLLQWPFTRSISV